MGVVTLDPLDCFLDCFHTRERVIARDGGLCRLL